MARTDRSRSPALAYLRTSSAATSHVVCSGRSTIVIYRASNARQRRNTKRATRNTEEIT